MNMARILFAWSACAYLLAVVIAACSAPTSRVVVRPAAVQGAEPVGMDTCAFCHAEKVRDFEFTAHYRPFVSKDERDIVGCEACHGEGSLHLEVGGGKGRFIINPEKNPAVCYECHAAKNAAFNLQYHHPVREGRIDCTHCHDPHGENIFLAEGMKMGLTNAVCNQCHREKAGHHVFEHEALREGCTMCHNPHGSINDKLLVENDNNLCLKCHGQVALPGTVTIGDFDHTGQLTQGACWSAGCHTAVHGSNINPHLRY
ncbi:MAG: cytochrome c3 family protein [Desulfobacterales bacterium]